MSKSPNPTTPAADDRTRPMMALPTPDQGTDRVEIDEDDGLTRPMAALPDPDEPPAPSASDVPDPTRPMRALIDEETDDGVDPGSLTRPMRGLSDLWGPTVNDESEPPEP